jgi:integrase
VRGHVRKRGKKWCVVLDLERDPETGKRRQKWVSGFGTKGAAEDALVDLLGAKKRGDVLDPDKTPLAEYVSAWLDGRVGQLAPLSVVQYRSHLKNHIAPAPLGSMPLGKIRRAHVRAFEQSLEAKGLALSTRGVVRAVLSRAFADAVLDDLIGSNPADSPRRSGEHTSRRPKRFTVWTDSELRTLLDVVADDRLAALWRLAVATGARRGELLGVTWLNYSFEQSTVTIAQQVVPTRGGVTIAECKTKGSHRTIRLDAETVATLERHREAQIAEKEHAGDAYDDRDLIFCDELGAPINPQRLTDAWREHRAAAGIRPGRLHDVRHTAATHLLTAGVPVHVVAARLGHSSPVITLNTYAHVLPTTDDQAAAVMAAVLASAG